MNIKIKKLSEKAVIPSYAKPGDAGMDLTATSVKFENGEGTYLEYGTGLSVEIPEGFVGLVFPRSSVSKRALLLANSVGVIDSGYRGEIKLRFKIESDTDPVLLAALFLGKYYSERDLLKEDIEDVDVDDVVKNVGEIFYLVGERVAQLMIIPHPQINFEEVEDLSETERTGGFGSTGN